MKNGLVIAGVLCLVLAALGVQIGSTVHIGWLGLALVFGAQLV